MLLQENPPKFRTLLCGITGLIFITDYISFSCIKSIIVAFVCNLVNFFITAIFSKIYTVYLIVSFDF